MKKIQILALCILSMFVLSSCPVPDPIPDSRPDLRPNPKPDPRPDPKALDISLVEKLSEWSQSSSTQ